MKKALIFWGGWDGHFPEQVSNILKDELEKNGWEVNLQDNQDVLQDLDYLKSLDVICPQWTMGTLGDNWANLNEAIMGGVGFAGAHGGSGDAFRDNISYMWMVGGQFVGHPHVGDYVVDLTDVKSEITKDISRSFDYNSEQYYMITDPGNNVLATTQYTYEDNTITMPVIWTKTWGKGRVFYSSLGHDFKEYHTYPEMLTMVMRGFEWAAAGKPA
ncbi:ThuA domain-containing protein [bacterium AH-315-E10]|nr:ThuA domain-containing protein [bacterium AH-315-E10]